MNKNVDKILLKKLEESRNTIRNTYKSIDDLYDEMKKSSIGYVGMHRGKEREYFFEIRPDKWKRVVYLSKIFKADPRNLSYSYHDSFENRTIILGLSSDNMLQLNDEVRQYKIEVNRAKKKNGDYAIARDKGSIPLSKSPITESFQIEDKTKDGLFIRIDNELVKFLGSSLSNLEMTRTNLKGSCYVATSVYGTYDCPELWALRRYRDDILASSWYGRLFIKAYYTFSPGVIKIFGNSNWFNRYMKEKLDRMVNNLNKQGIESTPYEDRTW